MQRGQRTTHEITIPEARKVVWDVGNITLGQAATSKEARVIISDELDKMFGWLDTVQGEADVILPVLPKGETPRITVGALTESLTTEIQTLYKRFCDDEQFMNEIRMDPFAARDLRFDVLSGLQLCFALALDELQSGK